MQDRFKFRFWKNDKKMIYDDLPHLELYEPENYKWMQCTGLKDKNGKLIYEGDIVKNDKNLLYYVLFNSFEYQTKFCLKKIENPDYYPHISTWQGIGYKDQKNYEVIGNIYKNKDLLNE